MRIRRSPLHRVADGQPHEKTVQLAFREGVGAVVLEGILGRQHQEGSRKLECLVVDCDRSLLHGLQEPALGSGRSPVDLVGQENVGENGSRPGLELGGPGIVEGHSQDIGGEEITGELDSPESQPQASSKGMGQGSLPNTRDVLEKDMPTSEKSCKGEANYLPLSVEDTLDLVNQAFKEFLPGSNCPICHCIRHRHPVLWGVSRWGFRRGVTLSGPL